MNVRHFLKVVIHKHTAPIQMEVLLAPVERASQAMASTVQILMSVLRMILAMLILLVSTH